MHSCDRPVPRRYCSDRVPPAQQITLGGWDLHVFRYRAQRIEVTQLPIHPSIAALGINPVGTVTNRAREIVFRALQNGWSGPPFDPRLLAQQQGISVVPTSGEHDARIVPAKGSRFRIEYNPARPPYRINFSIAHEIAHTLFPDCGEQVRHRLSRKRISATESQLETLCDIAAAEMLMPIGTFPTLASESLNIERAIALQNEYQVSIEAIVYRLARLSHQHVMAFCCTQIERGPAAGCFRA